MTWTCRLVERQFTPAEAAQITGVSSATQRDWRRHKLINGNGEGGWTKWDLSDLIRLSVMKLFSAAGMEVSKTGTLASMAMMPTHAAVHEIPGAVLFEAVGVSEEEAQAAAEAMGPRYSNTSRHFGRYLAALGPEEFDVCRTDRLSSLEDLLEEHERPLLHVVDCKLLAQVLASRAEGPLIRYVVERSAAQAEHPAGGEIR
jgi:DNA-binding transcriptional MerR regulator